jgi:hypothetical protein
MNQELSSYRNAIYGVWLGKTFGGNAGAPTEGDKTLRNYRSLSELPRTTLPNDDLDIQIVWLHAVRLAGGAVASAGLGAAWLRHIQFPWSEYKAAQRNLARGLPPPLTGIVDNLFFGESMGCPIRSEVWGCLAGGNPERAAAYARIDGTIDHWGFSVDAEAFLAATLASLVGKPGAPSPSRRDAHALREALAVGAHIAGGEIPSFLQNIEGICAATHDVATVRRRLLAAFPASDGMDARINVAISVAALLLGRGDFSATLLAALNMGYDADCTGATVGAMVGALLGGEALAAILGDLSDGEIKLSPAIVDVPNPGTVQTLVDWTVEVAALAAKSPAPVPPPTVREITLPSWTWQVRGPYFSETSTARRQWQDPFPYEHGDAPLHPFSHILGTALPAEDPGQTVVATAADGALAIASHGDFLAMPTGWRRLKTPARVIAERTFHLPPDTPAALICRCAGTLAVFLDGKPLVGRTCAGTGVPFEHLFSVPPCAQGELHLVFVIDSPAGAARYLEVQVVQDHGNHPHQELAMVEKSAQTVTLSVDTYLALALA